EDKSHLMAVPEPNDVFDGHCVDLVGYRDDSSIAGGGAFLFRNSWGPEWSDGGYAWMPYEVLNQYVNDLVSVRVRAPLSPPAGSPVLFEAEALEAADVKGKRPSIQEMAAGRFGWSGGKQLLFQGIDSGDGFTLPFRLETAGRLEVRLGLTRAEDFG